MTCGRRAVLSALAVVAAAPAATLALAACQSVPGVRVHAHNPLDLPREEVVEVAWADLTAALPELTPPAVRVVRPRPAGAAGSGAEGGSELPSQVLDQDRDGTPESLLFLAPFHAGETVVVRVEVGPPADVEPRVDAYHDAGRDDVAWESDRIAFRTYGQGLWALEELVSSGVDVLTKRVTEPVLERWYADGDYHTDHGEGADFFSVGETLGAGGTSLLADEAAHDAAGRVGGAADPAGGALSRAANFSSWQILADGPLRAVVELAYDPRDVGGVRVAEIRRIAIDAGSNLFRQETRYEVVEGAPDTLVQAVGTVRRPGLVASWDPSAPWPWLATWQPVGNGGHGQLGTAVLLPPGSSLTPRDVEGHAVVLLRGAPTMPFVQYVGAGWTAHGFDDVRAWWAYLGRAGRRLASPIEVEVGG